MYFVATAAWIVVTGINWLAGNRKVPVIIGILGVLVQIGFWGFGLGFWAISALGILTLVGMFAAPQIFLGQG